MKYSSPPLQGVPAEVPQAVDLAQHQEHRRDEEGRRSLSRLPEALPPVLNRLPHTGHRPRVSGALPEQIPDSAEPPENVPRTDDHARRFPPYK